MYNVMDILGMFWPILILIVIYYFFLHRPQKKMQLERGRFLLSLKKGDHVVTSGGIHGTIKVLRDKYVELEIAPKTVIKVEKTAVQRGDVDLIDEEAAKSAGAAAIGAADMNPEASMKAKKDSNVETEVIEEVVEVDNPEDAGTEVVEEVVEVDENGKVINEDKK